MIKKKKEKTEINQEQLFKETAKTLGCNEKFDLKKIIKKISKTDKSK